MSDPGCKVFSLVKKGKVDSKNVFFSLEKRKRERFPRLFQDLNERMEASEKQARELKARLAAATQELNDARASHLSSSLQLAATSKQLALTAHEMGCALGSSRSITEELCSTKMQLQVCLTCIHGVVVCLQPCFASWAIHLYILKAVPRLSSSSFNPLGL